MQTNSRFQRTMFFGLALSLLLTIGLATPTHAQEKSLYQRVGGYDARWLDEACHAVHAAVLDQLARDGIVKWHASKTSGDYARELRRRGWPMHAEFRAVARDFERVVFGARGVARDDYLRLRAASERLVARRAAA